MAQVYRGWAREMIKGHPIRQGCFAILTKVVATRSAVAAAVRQLPNSAGSIRRPGSSVVERGPEKAGVGGSIPSLATTL